MAISKSLKSLYNRQLVVDGSPVEQFPNSWTAATAGLVYARAGKKVELQTRTNPSGEWTRDEAGSLQLQTRLDAAPAAKATGKTKDARSKSLFELADSARYLAQNLANLSDEHKAVLRDSMLTVASELGINLRVPRT